jgi:hypothetical protein
MSFCILSTVFELCTTVYALKLLPIGILIDLLTFKKILQIFLSYWNYGLNELNLSDRI